MVPEPLLGAYRPKRQLEDTLRGLGLPEVDYFLEHFAPSFSKTLDELTE